MRTRMLAICQMRPELTNTFKILFNCFSKIFQTQMSENFAICIKLGHKTFIVHDREEQICSNSSSAWRAIITLRAHKLICHPFWRLMDLHPKSENFRDYFQLDRRRKELKLNIASLMG